MPTDPHGRVLLRGHRNDDIPAVIDQCHDGQDLIHWKAAVGNWASAKSGWRNGFRLEGHGRGLCLRPDGGVNVGWIATLHRDDPRTPGQPWPRLAFDRGCRRNVTTPAPPEP